MVVRLALLAAAALASSAATAAAQGRLLAGELQAQNVGTASVHMQLRYEVQPDAGATHVPISLLQFGITLDSLRVRIAGSEVPVTLRQASPGRLLGDVPLEPASSGPVVLELAYAVRPADRGRVTLPVMAVLWPPAQALPGRFKGELHVAADLAAFNAFPATLRAGTTQGEARSWTLSMPVVPAVVSFHLAAEPPAVTLAGALNAAVVMLTLAFCLLLWRQFRAQAQP